MEEGNRAGMSSRAAALSPSQNRTTATELRRTDEAARKIPTNLASIAVDPTDEKTDRNGSSIDLNRSITRMGAAETGSNGNALKIRRLATKMAKLTTKKGAPKNQPTTNTA